LRCRSWLLLDMITAGKTPLRISFIYNSLLALLLLTLEYFQVFKQLKAHVYLKFNHLKRSSCLNAT